MPPPGEKKVAPLQALLPNSMESVVGQVPTETLLTRPGFSEPTPVEETVTENAVGAGTRQAGPSQAGLEVTPAPGKPKGPPQQKPPYTAKGVLEPGLSPTEQQLYAEASQNILKADRAKTANELIAMGITEAGLSDYANIGALDAVEAERLNKEHFSVAKQRMDGLYERVQAARSLKMNPYNWQQSIGRGGRVSAAFSLLAGQMAAGAGNPNSALKMMDAAIERDISAQEQNIRQEFDSMKLTAGLGRDARALHEEEMASINEVRALKYSAILGRIGAAKQHAINASAYESYKVMEDHYIIKQLEAIRAERARILSVYVDSPIRASKLRALQAEVQQLAEQMRPGTQISGPRSVGQPTTAVQAEPSAGTALPSAPGRAGSVGPRKPRPTSAATPLPVGGAASEQASSQQAATGREDEALAMSVAGEPARAPAKAPGREKFTEETVGKILKGGFGNMPPHVSAVKLLDGREESGYGLATRVEAGDTTATEQGIRESMRAYEAGEDFSELNDGFSDKRDAAIFAKMVPPPNREQYPTDAGYQEALQMYKLNSKRWEVYEQEGKQNTIIAGGRKFRLRASSTARNDDANGINHYNEMATKLNQAAQYTRTLKRVADAYVQVGPGGWLNETEGAFSIPGLNSYDPQSKEINQYSTTLAMQYIKSEDPTARLSDKDIEVGERAMALYKNGKVAFLDIVQSFDGKFSNNTVRQAMNRYLQKLAQKAQLSAFEIWENDLVPDYNTSVEIAKEADAVQQWINTHRKGE